jgi:Ca2+:H+ antiporter
MNINPLIKELRHNPMLWLLVLVPVVLAAAKLVPTAHTLLFVLSVLAIVPLAALLSHATESVAEKTGDTVGGLLNATLGNLTELVIAAAALRAGEYALVKGSIAGAIVTNTLFMLGFIVPSRRSQAPHPGVQPRHRSSGRGLTLPGGDCAG